MGNAVSVRFTLDTIAPAAPSFDLSIGSDSGVLGDQQTAYARVTLVGTTEPGAGLTLVQTGATGLASNTGSFFLPDIALALNQNVITIQARDLAGNLGQATRTFTRVPATDQTDPVLDWNHQALEAIRLDAENPPEATRSLAIMHAAILDTVNAIEGTPAHYVSLPAQPGTSVVAAIAAAGHRELAHLYPAQQAAFDAVLANSLAQVPDGPGKTNGVVLGRAILADAIIALRKNDGYDAFGEYYGGTDCPGQWQPTALLCRRAPACLSGATSSRSSSPAPTSSICRDRPTSPARNGPTLSTR